MYLKHKPNGDVGEILDRGTLFDPARRGQTGRIHRGEHLLAPVFPSDVLLTRCRVDPHYPERP